MGKINFMSIFKFRERYMHVSSRKKMSLMFRRDFVCDCVMQQLTSNYLEHLLFFHEKSFKIDWKLHTVVLRYSLLICINVNNHIHMVKIIASKVFFLNAVYHLACITKYLLKSTTVQSGNTVIVESEHELPFRLFVECLVVYVSLKHGFKRM